MKTRPTDKLAKQSKALRALPDRDFESAKDRGAKAHLFVTAEAPESAGAIRC
ncbi:MAG: hypothetical protein H0V17_21335 [Deltaproteobacteria bacterium]|nr:hypothetical protein [Deltaproteobacteria bacterium]